MTNREKLQHLIDELSEPDVDEALQYIIWQQENGFTNLLHALPSEHSPEEQTSEEGSSGRVIFLDELKHDQGIGQNAVS